MDEISDIENADAEDLNELEARLYAQIHHGSVCEGEEDPATEVIIEKPKRLVNKTSVNNNNSPSNNRYWSEDNAKISKNVKSINRQQIAVDSTAETTSENPKNSETVGNGNKIEIISVEGVTIKSDQDLNISEKNSSQNGNKKNEAEKSNFSLPQNNRPSKNTKGKQSANKPEISRILKGPFGKQLQKLQHVLKMQNKKGKSETVRNKAANQVSTIVLNTSDEDDDDDVVEVPLPTPPTYTVVDSSDEEKEDGHIDKKFKKESEDKTEKENVNEINPRCISPHSILSTDDFIGHTDVSGSQAIPNMPDDDDVLLLQADVDSLMGDLTFDGDYNTSGGNEKNKTDNEVAGCSGISSFAKPQNEPKNSDLYRSNQPSSHRTLDIYESESDIQESIYSKGASGTSNNKKQTNNIASVEIEVSSSDIEEVIDVTQKTKRLRKRRASSVREIDMHKDGDSSDSPIECEEINDDDDSNHTEDDDDDDDNGLHESRATGIPFIFRGNAVERLKPIKSRKSKSAKPSANRNKSQMSDNEFLATLNTLAQGKNNSNVVPTESNHANRRMSEDESDDDDDDEITARAIAEKVLNTESETNPSIAMNVDSPEIEITRNQSLSNVVNDALPESINDLQDIFNRIDNFDNKKNTNDDDNVPDEDEMSNHSNDVELIEPEPRQIYAKRIKRNKRDLEQGDLIYNVVYCEEENFNSGIGWNDEMRRFYNCKWNGESFSVGETFRKMNPQKSLWKIHTEDRFPRSNNKGNKLKCLNCCEFGHVRAKCPRPRKPLICYMCGEQGHREPRCPNTLCLRCGNKTRVYTKSCGACTFQNQLICPLCKLRGHTLNFCPDKWRRYHSTIATNAYPNNDIEYRDIVFCCFCGSRGHLSENCRSSVRFLDYPLSTSEIKSHQKSYNDLAMKTLRPGIAFNLLYNPEDDVCFEFGQNKNQTHYYGRFLKAVGLGHLMQRKENNKHNNYVVNPFAKSIQKSSPTKRTSSAVAAEKELPSTSAAAAAAASAQIQQMDVDDEQDVVETVECVEADSTQEIITTSSRRTNEKQFKTPNTIPPQTSTTAGVIEMIDSDSNYSFSEHFDGAQTERNEQEKEQQVPSRSYDDSIIPDYIPLQNQQNDKEDDENEDDLLLTNVENNQGISAAAGISQKYGTFTTADSDNDGDGDNQNDDGIIESYEKATFNDLPCEAKIYLTNFYDQFLHSKEGQEFLKEKSKKHKVKTRLEKTSLGPVLIIFGLKSNQDQFHVDLLLIFRQHTDFHMKTKTNQLESAWLAPRKSDALIRYLRKHIRKLFNPNLGKANFIYKEMKIQENRYEKFQDKKFAQSADRLRTTLNMILIGQAGLHDGNMHLDKLLLILKSLINDYKSGQNVSDQLRKDADHHFKFIFSPYKYDNYIELLRHYDSLVSKNRLTILNIDQRLLGTSGNNNEVGGEQTSNEIEELINEQNMNQIQNTPSTSSYNKVKSSSSQQQRPAPSNRRQQQYEQQKSQTVLNPLCSMNANRFNQVQKPQQQEQQQNRRSLNNFQTSNRQQQQHQLSISSNNNMANQKRQNAANFSHSTNEEGTGGCYISREWQQQQQQQQFNNRQQQQQQQQFNNRQQQQQQQFNNRQQQQQQQQFNNNQREQNLKFPRSSAKTTTKGGGGGGGQNINCNSLLSQIENDSQNINTPQDCRRRSPFWSKEARIFIEECLNYAQSNRNLMTKLLMVKKRSQNNELSYNDYRAIIKIHKVLTNKT